MKTPDKEYFENPEKYIPYGMYCYDLIEGTNKWGFPNTKNCPFWDRNPTKEEQNWGYCHYLKQGDWMDNSWGLLWDQCKICGINDIEDENIALDNN